MKNPLIATGLSTLAAAISLISFSGSAQDNGDIDRKLRELNIMDNIFEAALEEEADSGLLRRIGRAESMYLADQGMVFSFRVVNVHAVRVMGQRMGEPWQEYMNEMLEMTEESLELVRESFPDLDFDFDRDIDFDFDDRVFVSSNPRAPQAPRSVHEVFFVGDQRGGEWEAMREMEDAMRDTQDEVRDMQRQVRRLERQLRNDESDTDALEAEIGAIEEQMESELAVLEEQQQAYEEFITNLENMRREQQLVAVDEASSQIIGTLCDYGGTLKSLDNEEHVTIILEDVVDDNDQVYVFSYNDIRDCSSAEDLKNSAQAYQMVGF